ncbi:MAG TPA: metallophosphoesterase [Niabella sp.]|nr:metallophosphoesterase [Niabella sp.]HQW16124.1 metallophosphoesterase [Niabella sp.]HQX21336.1 metallophosphoesterase [Niabella sp.]HQX42812.1 metallophosphoesterase [Niabella sp.]HRB08119.1 metallophosphoesterase [Niabella sp.]
MNRKSFLKLISGLGATGLITGLYSWKIEPYWLEFTKMDMSIRNLPATLDGKILMQISDIHVGNKFDHKFIIEAFEKAKRVKPDFVVYTGDYITLHEERIEYEKLYDVLNHAVKGRLGTVAVLGNHDYGIDFQDAATANEVTEILEEFDLPVLRNEQKEIHGLNFIGFDDYWGTNFNPPLVMDHIDIGRANLVLNHNPDVCDLDVWNGYQGWILSGHTHGGQCKPPFLPPLVLPVKNKKYNAGKIDAGNGRTVYINRALGCRFPIRFNVRPEISIFTLKPAP